MQDLAVTATSALKFAQIGWVVKDITDAEQFFREAMGIKTFGKIETMRSKDYDATYYGEPADYETRVCQAFSGGSFIELIQPVSGQSMFQDYLDKNPAGGIQHVAFSMPVAGIDQVVAEMENDGFPVIASFDTSIAKIFFFDTFDAVGVATEIMGITAEGEAAIEKMKAE